MRFLWLLSMLFLFGIPLHATLRIKDTMVEGQYNPLGINTLNPTFSWKLSSDRENVRQRSYRIRVGSDEQFQGLLWDSGWVDTDQSLFHRYAGALLQSGTTYYFRVEVSDNHGDTAVSEIGFFHTGLIDEENWGRARWIAREKLPDSLINPLPLSSSTLRIDKNYDLPVFRKSFALSKKLKASYAYVSGLGHYELYLNGEQVDDSFLQPGWTKYDKEAYYVVYDITSRLQQDNNTIGAMLGNGFYYIPPIKGRYQKHKVAFGLPKLKMKIVHHYDDGTTEEIVSDETWKVHSSPITFSSIYGGEDYDANVLGRDWRQVDFDDRTWDQAILVDGPPLRAQEIEPVRVMESFQPVHETTLADKGSTVYDFGQNASGIVELTMRGNKGDTVRVYPAELLREDGSVNQRPTGSPHYYQYVFGDEEQVTWSPRFTYYGFRYAEVFAQPAGSEKIEILAIQADHIRNSTATVGRFHSSDTLFNQIHELITWGIKSNMVSVFTDCPHREKLGWLEQLHLMGPSVQYNFDAARLFAKALADMRHSQTEDGLVPEIAPEYVQFDWGGDMFRDSPEWGSSSIILPWYAYQWYGNPDFLTDNYPMMKRYIQYLKTKAVDNILYQGLSDWYDIGPERPGVSQLTPAGITGTAIYHYNLEILSKIADQLGHPSDKAYFDSLRNEVYQSFHTTFYDKGKQWYGTGSQTAQAMALYMGLVDEENREPVWNTLLKDIFDRDTAFTAGDVGHRYLIQTLFDHGRDDVIYAMHKDDSRPGYGYQIRKGATALTESWAALPSVSNNHFMLGHLMEWLHAGLGGIRQDPHSTAFRRLVIEPRLWEEIPSCEVGFETPYGEVLVSRDHDGKQLEIGVQIPVNSECVLRLPQGTYTVNGKKMEAYPIQIKDGLVEIGLGSGQYKIRN